MSRTKKADNDHAIALAAKRLLGRAQADAADILETELDGGVRFDRDKNRLVGRIQGLRDAIRHGGRDVDKELLGL